MSLADLDLSSTPARRQGRPYVVIGGGPAGLTAGYLLAKEGKRVIVLEADEQVGGLAKTVVDPDGYRFDLGGHRFFTKSKEVNDLWLEIMGDEFLLRPRQSRHLLARQVPRLPPPRGGRRQEARPDRAAALPALLPVGRDQAQGARGQRRAVGLQPLRQAPVQPLLQVLHREGVGRADHRAARRVGRPADQGPVVLQRRQGGVLRQPRRQDQVADRPVPVPPLRPGPDVGEDDGPHRGARRRGPARDARDEARDGLRRRGHRRPHGGRGHRAEGRDLLAAAARDGRHRRAVGARSRVHEAAQGLRYRDFLTVALVLDGEDVFPDNWIYIHEPGVQVGRIQNYRSWSPWMVPDPDTACVGLEYFCFEGDDLWTMSDDDLVALATRELEQLGLAPGGQGPPRLRRARPEGLSDVRRGLLRARRRHQGLARRPRRTSSRSAATGCTATTTPTTRC